MNKVDTGDTAWLLVSAALVLAMTPALALFYAGMVRRKNVLSTLMYSFAAIPVLSVKWALFGYSLAFGTSFHGLVGGLDFIGLRGVAGTVHGTVPTFAFVAFQMMFAVITPALVSGAFAERMKFSAYLLFLVLWSTFVYDPVAHWVWADGGWLLKMGALDFAGGTVVHLTAGLSALVCAIVIGKRLDYPKRKAVPHNLTMTLLGAGLLWFGWFGFNAGSALSSGPLAALSFVTTHLGAAGGAIGWLAIEWWHRKKPTALGAASGLVAGLVGITPAAGFVSPGSAMAIGFAAGLVCYGAVVLKDRFGYDDSLDAFGVHGVGGLAGALLTGVLAQKSLNDAGNDGALFGNPGLLGTQAIACAAAGAYAVIVTFVILKIIQATVGLRVSSDDEREGLDVTQHGEEGYALDAMPARRETLEESEEAAPEAAATPATASLRFANILERGTEDWHRKPNMRARFAVASVLALGLGLAACASKPTITLNHAELSSAGLQGIGFTIFLNVKNPNSYDVMVRNVRANVTLQDRYSLPPLQYNPNQWLGSNSTTVITAPVVIPWGLVPQLIHDTVQQPMLTYRCTGAADVTATRALQIEKNDYPVDESGTVPRQQIVDMATRAMIPF